MKTPKISDAAVRRLPVYLRYLTHLKQMNVNTVSSQQMGRTLDVNPAQIRKDLAMFGEFGKKGIGYDVDYLIAKIRQILKLDQDIHVALVGAGNLGHAICNYHAFLNDTLRISAVFDNDPKKIGQQIAGLVIQPLEELKPTVVRRNIRLAIITVPASAAQEVANRLIEAGIEGILNFAPTNIRATQDVRIHHADVMSSLQSLAYYLNERDRRLDGGSLT